MCLVDARIHLGMIHGLSTHKQYAVFWRVHPVGGPFNCQSPLLKALVVNLLVSNPSNELLAAKRLLFSHWKSEGEAAERPDASKA